MSTFTVMEVVLLLVTLVYVANCETAVTSCGKSFCEKSSVYPITSTVAKNLETDSRLVFLKTAPGQRNVSQLSEDDPDIPPELDAPLQICQSRTELVFPQEAQNTRGQRRFIINFGPFTQGITVERCIPEILRLPCTFVGLPPGYQSVCVQKEIEHRLTTIEQVSDQVQTGVDIFRFPSSCACRLVKAGIPSPLTNCPPPPSPLTSPLFSQQKPPMPTYVQQYSASASVYADEGAKKPPILEPRSFSGTKQWPSSNFASRTQNLFGSGFSNQQFSG